MEGIVAVTCRTCGMFVFLPEHVATYVCAKCKLIPLLEEKVQQLEARLATLKDIRDQESFLDTAQSIALDQRHSGDESTSRFSQEVTSQVEEIDTWQKVTHRTRKTKDHPVKLELQNQFNVLSQVTDDGDQQEESTVEDEVFLDRAKWTVLDEWKGDVSEEDQDSARKTAPVNSQRRRVVVIGDSLLRKTEAVICKPDKMSREVCCLPGAKIQHITDRLTRIIKPTDHHPLLLIHVGTNDVASHSLEKITRDFEALGRKLKNLNAQIVFSSVLPVLGHGTGRERKIVEVNNWLRRWCRKEQFGFLDHGFQFHEDGLLASDGLHLTPLGRNVFAKRLENLIRRALN